MSLLVILIGPPGSGKGTQGRYLSTSFGLSYLSSGELLRAAIAAGTDLGRAVREYMDRGEYVPDELMVPAATAAITPLLQRGNGVVLDGFPRTQSQALSLEHALREAATDPDWRCEKDRQDSIVTLALVFSASMETLVQRLSGRWVCSACSAPYHVVSHPPRRPGTCDKCHNPLMQRDDDRSETIRTRLQVYEQTVAPLIEHYRRQSCAVDVDGERGEADVSRVLCDAVGTAIVSPLSASPDRRNVDQESDTSAFMNLDSGFLRITPPAGDPLLERMGVVSRPAG
ncbi:MAG TPA: nucleoside monophosphate kinase [Chloroflexota bacterium]|nr:nucleoside monophosphate kinase [Chloroflexota bacterium]